MQHFIQVNHSYLKTSFFFFFLSQKQFFYKYSLKKKANIASVKYWVNKTFLK